MKITEYVCGRHEAVSIQNAVANSLGRDQELTTDAKETFGALIELLVEKEIITSNDIQAFISFDKYNIEE